MFNKSDIEQINSKDIHIEQVKQQIENFRTGFPYLKITETAGIDHGIVQLSDTEKEHFIKVYELHILSGIKPLKFVPASGAASRMFKTLFSALEDLQKGKSQKDVKNEPEIARFLTQINKFALYNDLVKLTKEDQISDWPLDFLLERILTDKGLNYGSLPKGLLKFHSYPDGDRTSMEEHLVEGALYAKNNDETVQLHFTVSPEHRKLFRKHLSEIQEKYEQLLQVKYEVKFSIQDQSTDTIAVTPDNEPFRNNDGSLLFRQAGHGALLKNLNDLKADLIFIKNIDNVVPDRFKQPTVEYKKALAGLLLSIQEKVFEYQRILKENHASALNSDFYTDAAHFLEKNLNIRPPHNQYYSKKEELYYYLKTKFHRPIRVCGMVKNLGEPGGGPFFAQCNDGSEALQIVESSQIDPNDQQQMELARSAGYFNPVDLICGMKDFMGQSYWLPDFSDPHTGFISVKSKDGKDLKAQELPGLWNGAMSGWITIFVEVPVETFNPVKTITDLLRKEHQSY